LTHVFEGKVIETVGQMGDVVLEIAKGGDKDRAKRFLESYRAFCKLQTGHPENADHNIGYWTGYLDRELAAKVRVLFDVRHPYFPDDVTWEEAFLAGQAMARGEDPRVDVGRSTS
jgi:hypothetical protein